MVDGNHESVLVPNSDVSVLKRTKLVSHQLLVLVVLIGCFVVFSGQSSLNYIHSAAAGAAPYYASVMLKNRDLSAAGPQTTKSQHQHRCAVVGVQYSQFPSDSHQVDCIFDHLNGGCPKQQTVQEFNQAFSKAVYQNTETTLVGTNRFVHCPDFDVDKDDVHLRGGVAMFKDAFLQSGGNFPTPTAFDCRTVYAPGGCKQDEQRPAKMWNQQMKEIKLDTAVMIYQFRSDAYYHAMVESLPRLVYVLDYLKVHPNTTILCNRPYIYRHRATINQLLGLSPAQRWAIYDETATYSIKRLLVPTATRCGNAQPKCVQEIQKATALASSIVKNVQNSTNKMILLHKRQTRLILNHNELLQALKVEFPNNVHEFNGSESFSDTIQLHHDADVIIGPHGAGFANIIFSRPGAGLVELHQQHMSGNSANPWRNTCHQATARAAGMPSRMLGQTDGSYFTDFTVNVTEAVDAVRELLKGKAH